MPTEAVTKGLWLSDLRSADRSIARNIIANNPDGLALRSKLAALIAEVEALETVEAVPAEKSTPSIIFHVINDFVTNGSEGFYAIPATEDISLDRAEDISHLLCLSIKKNKSAHAFQIERAQVKNLSKVGTFVESIDNAFINFRDAENEDNIFHTTKSPIFLLIRD